MAHKIRLRDDGFAFVDIEIKPMNTQTMARLRYKIDTGANCTTISCTELENLGYDKNWIKTGKLLVNDERPIAATGLPVDDCYIITIPQIQIGEWVGYNWPFMTSLSVPFKCLLGTDSMKFFNWNFDYARNICTFRLIPGKRKLLFNQTEQSIHSLDEINVE